MFVFTAGLALAVLAALVASRSGRSGSLAAGYALTTAATTWAAAALVAGNRIDGMGGIPHVVAAGVLFWFIVTPGAAFVGIAEWRRRRRTQ